ncbi:hypothetical protein BGZ65_005541 [Modicella reniformis]|uniref:Uncharacterized protein n=1 Tax=Modicella reniformis TaxID=1440133 RepID=A0A9P6MGP4_9FUNG|nr:hypothetical protein BGZ65_005541 [Modicella reniformis]
MLTTTSRPIEKGSDSKTAKSKVKTRNFNHPIMYTFAQSSINSVIKDAFETQIKERLTSGGDPDPRYAYLNWQEHAWSAGGLCNVVCLEQGQP